MTLQTLTSERPQKADRVRANSADRLNAQIDRETQACVAAFAREPREEITRHIDELAREWDMERYLQTNASILALGGVLLGATVSRKFLAVPAIVFSFLLQHAVQGWCPPVPVFRRFSVRTRKEINREQYAMKALRGDFDAPARDGEAA